MKFSDIQLTDKQLWGQFQTAYQQGDFATALALLNNTQLNNKALTADILNALTDYIVQVENLNDSSFKMGKIRIEPQVPTDLTMGQVYFDWTNSPAYRFSQLAGLNYTFRDVDNLALTWNRIDNGGW